MSNVTAQIGQLLSENTNAAAHVGKKLHTGKTKGLDTGDALLGQKSSGDIFGMLLSGLNKSGAASLLTTTITPGKKDAGKGLLGVNLTPEGLQALKALTPDDLKNLPPELAAFLAPHMTEAGTLDDTATTVLDALTTALSGDGQAPEALFKVVSDPKLADFLAGFTAQLANLQTPGNVATTADISFASLLGQVANTGALGGTVKNADGTTPSAADVAAAATSITSDTHTVTIAAANLDSDSFQNLKKLAFADLAPFLTQPRLVHTSGNNVMKVAQGPAFLNDDSNNASILTAMAGIAPALPASMFSTKTDAATPGSAAAALAAATTTETPMFLDASVLAKGIAAQGHTASTVLPQQNGALNRGNIFAALLGLPMEQVQGGPSTGGVVVTNTHTAVKGDTTGAVLPQVGIAQNAAGINAVASAQMSTAIQQAAANPAHVVAAVKMAEQVSKGLEFDSDGNSLTGLDASLRIHADQTLPTNTGSALMSSAKAGQPHPASVMVSIAMRAGADGVTSGERQFVIQLDPQNLGRVKITLDIAANNSVKAKIVAERPETMAMLQKDAGMLERALQDAGLTTNAGALSFNMGDGGSFSGYMGQNQNPQQQNQQADEDGTDLATIENVMSIFVDPNTGLTHVNVVI